MRIRDVRDCEWNGDIGRLAVTPFAALEIKLLLDSGR